MWHKKTLISFCSFVALSSAWTSAHSTDSDVVSVAGSYGLATQQAAVIEQTLKSEMSASSFTMIALTPVSSVKIQAFEKQDSIPMQIGFSRNVTLLSSVENTEQQLKWQKLDGKGYSAGIQINSPQALAVRVGMTVENIPENAEFRFFSIQDGTAVDIQLISARKILDTLNANMEADPTNPDGDIFWSPTANSDTLGLEVYLPENDDPSSVQIAFPLISHITRLPFGSTGEKFSTQSIGDSNPCQNDATCATDWKDLSKTVAGMQFSTSDGTYVCTGSLLNDLDTDTLTPYFISANHCISTQTVASTLETHWFYQSATCNGSSLSSSYERITGGATLLHTQGMSSGEPTSNSMDTTLLELNSAAPSGAYYAAWTTAPPPGFGTSRTGIHHPQADLKKISYGTADNDMACGWMDGDQFGCLETSGNFYQVNWTDGGTEGGSSGSGLYYNNEEIIGTLSGGNGECAGTIGIYSSFRAAYSAGNYEQWLYTEAEPEPEPEPEPATPVVAPMNFLLLR